MLSIYPYVNETVDYPAISTYLKEEEIICKDVRKFNHLENYLIYGFELISAYLYLTDSIQEDKVFLTDYRVEPNDYIYKRDSILLDVILKGISVSLIEWVENLRDAFNISTSCEDFLKDLSEDGLIPVSVIHRSEMVRKLNTFYGLK